MSSADNHPQTIYEIVVQGELDQSWQQWFNSPTVTLTRASVQSTTTTLVGPVVDQAALRGMLCKLWDLNLTLISVRRIEADDKKEKPND
jgi:hypothetical protein